MTVTPATTTIVTTQGAITGSGGEMPALSSPTAVASELANPDSTAAAAAWAGGHAPGIIAASPT